LKTAFVNEFAKLHFLPIEQIFDVFNTQYAYLCITLILSIIAAYRSYLKWLNIILFGETLQSI